jgi:hypothetical protein
MKTPTCLLMLALLPGCGGGGSGEQAPVVNVVQQSFFVQDAVSVSGVTVCPGTATRMLPLDVCAPIDDSTSVTIDGRPHDIGFVRDGTDNGNAASFRVTRTTSSSVSGNIQTQRVTSIDIQSVVVGPIDSLDPPHARFSAMGQQIYVSDLTVFARGSSFSTLAVGDRVFVSGFFSGTGAVIATAISESPTTDGFTLRGILNAEPSGGFRIGGMRLDLAGATVAGFPAAPAAGDPVLVLADAAPSSEVLVAQSIRFIGGELSDSGDTLHLVAGLVTNRPTASQMDVAGRPVDCDFYHCENLPGAQIGTMVGVLQFSGSDQVTALATASDDIQVTGSVGAVDSSNSSLTVLGFQVQVTPAALVVDATGQPARIADIGVGDTVSVSGGPVGDLIVAARVDTSGGQPSLWARTASYAEPDIRILGQTVVTDASTPVDEDCVGTRDQAWLFEAASSGSIDQLRIDVSGTGADTIFTDHIDVDDGACSPWDY